MRARCLLLALVLVPVGCRSSGPPSGPPRAGMATVAARPAARPVWKKRVLGTGFRALTAKAGDFTGDGKMDVVSGAYTVSRIVLYAAPDFEERVISKRAALLHSATADVDGDGDLDFIGAQFQPGLVFWLETPADGTAAEWTARVIDGADAGGVDGVHGLVSADVDGDGGLDVIANSNLDTGPLARSIVWLARPAAPRSAGRWARHVIAAGDAPGLSHYPGFGDVNGDGLGDVAIGAKVGNTFAWWEQPKGGGKAWRKHLLASSEPGATHMVMRDVDGDGAVDLVASRGHGRGLAWWKGPGYERRTLDDTMIWPHAMDVADVDGDGDLDVASASATEGQGVAWFENDGKGAFTKHLIDATQRGYHATLVDMDADGDLDLVLAGENSNNVVLFENAR